MTDELDAVEGYVDLVLRFADNVVAVEEQIDKSAAAVVRVAEPGDAVTG